MTTQSPTVHQLLLVSYSVYFFGFLTGFALDLLLPPAIQTYELFGMVCIVLATLLIVWAQSTTSRTKELRKTTVESTVFSRGPYVITRAPTHLGLTLLMIGAGALFGALYIIFAAIISFVVVAVFILPKEEALLEKKYGGIYVEYKNSVRRFFGKK